MHTNKLHRDLGWPPRLCLLFGLFCLSPAAIGAASLPERITILTEQYPPYSFADEGSGRIIGMATEIVQLALDRAGIRGDFKSQPWSRSEHEALNGANILLYPLGRTREREDKFKWVGVICEGRDIIYTLDKSIRLKSFEDVQNYRVGTIYNDIEESYFTKFGHDYGKNLISVGRHEQNYAKLKAGRIDLWPMNSLVMSYVVSRAGDNPNDLIPLIDLTREFAPGGRIEIYMAFGKMSDDHLVESLRDALQEVKASGQVDRVLQKWEMIPGDASRN